MSQPKPPFTGTVTETIRGIVDRVTYHNPENGWSVLRVVPFDNPHQQETVTVHQTRVFAGATMEFRGSWQVHAKYGRQFRATQALERKPATSAALEKYLGSGLIKGVGPKTARKIVAHFGNETLDVFEDDIERLTEVPGIARRKLATIREAWREHRAIRNVMMFLQSHGISTLFAVRIYQAYGDDAIAVVNEDPYRLARDIFGIGFFSADRIALSIGLARESPRRIQAAIGHVLAAGREFGHCYLTESQITAQVNELLGLAVDARIPELLDALRREDVVKVRVRTDAGGAEQRCYYAKSLFFDEGYVARRIAGSGDAAAVDGQRVDDWIRRYSRSMGFVLSPGQADAVRGIAGEHFSVLTGGPGCGKTTTTLVVVRLLEAMRFRVLLAAPTGRAAQRMTDVIGREAKTIHRLLEWRMGGFRRDESNPLEADAVIVDECSMLDVSLTAALLRAVPPPCRVLFIGDADQLPSVGAGNVLRDIIASGAVRCFELKTVFRQAQASLIVKYAHQINRGEMPHVASPFRNPDAWQRGVDCLFIDSDEATREQLHFIARVKRVLGTAPAGTEAADGADGAEGALYEFRADEPLVPFETELTIPEKFRHVDLENVLSAGNPPEELLAVLKRVHPWSSLHYNLTAFDVVGKLYLEWIPKYFGDGTEIQVLSPMTRGSLGTVSLNRMIQEAANPAGRHTSQITVGDRIFRVGDRVIHRRNNYDLNVFNGDIGTIERIDAADLTLSVAFSPDGRRVAYTREAIPELDLAYAITIHKSQGSEFETVILPVLTQHFKMLYRNLIYTGLTRARRLAVLVGTRQALALAVGNRDTSLRQTFLRELLDPDAPAAVRRGRG